MAQVVAFAFVLLLATAGLIDLVAPMERSPDVVTLRDFVQQRKSSAFRDGKMARLYEAEVRDASRLRALSTPWHALVWYGLFGEIDGPVVEGADGYLFLVDRLRFDARLVDRRAASIAVLFLALERRLADRGQRWVFLPIPEKGEVLDAKVPAHLRGGTRRSDALIAAFRERGVTVVDLLEAWRHDGVSEPYCRTDSHWSLEGERVAAEALVTAAKFSTPPKERGAILVEFPATIEPPCVLDIGDLLRLGGMRLADLQQGRSASEFLKFCGRLYGLGGQAIVPDPGAAPPGTIQARLSGTSFSAFPGFAEFVQHASGGRVEVRSFPAASPQRIWDQLETVDSELQVVALEMPVFALFGADEPIAAAGGVFARLSAPTAPSLADLARVAAIDSIPWTRRRDGSSWRYELPARSVYHGGSGHLGIRCALAVRGRPAVVTVEGGDVPLSVTLAAGEHDLTLPLLATKSSDRIGLTLTANPLSNVDVKICELVTDLDPRAATALGSFDSSGTMVLPRSLPRGTSVLMVAEGVGAATEIFVEREALGSVRVPIAASARVVFVLIDLGMREPDGPIRITVGGLAATWRLWAVPPRWRDSAGR